MNDFDESITTANYYTAKNDAQKLFVAKLLSAQSLANVSLLLGVQQKPFESLESLLFRATEENGLTGITALMRALGLPARFVLNPKRHEQLSTCFGAGADELIDAIPTYSSTRGMKGVIEFAGHSFSCDQLAVSTSRLCPQCLVEHGYGRSYWTLSPFAVCEEHGVQLIDCCPDCGSPISRARPAYSLCSCGANLAEAIPKFASPGARWLCALIAHRYKHDDAYLTSKELRFPDAQLNKLALASLLDMVAFFGVMQPNQKVTRLWKLTGMTSLRVALTALERAARALADWPNGFYAELRRSRAYFPQSESLAHVAKSIDHVLHLAGIYMAHDGRRFIIDEIGNFLGKPDEWNEARKHYALQRRAA